MHLCITVKAVAALGFLGTGWRLALAGVLHVQLLRELHSARVQAHHYDVLAHEIVVELWACACICYACFEELIVTWMVSTNRCDNEEGEHVVIEDVDVPRAVGQLAVGLWVVHHRLD